MRVNRALLIFVLVILLATLASAESGIVVLHEDGFPAADSAPASDSILRGALSGAEFASAGELKQRLSTAKLLVLPRYSIILNAPRATCGFHHTRRSSSTPLGS